MPNLELSLNSLNFTSPNYEGLVRFLIAPFLETPSLLSFDCEQLTSTRRVWIRLAFEENDKGKIYGRGGRNIQAIKNVLQTAALAAGDTLYLEIYEGKDNSKFITTHPQSSTNTLTQPSVSKDSSKEHGRRILRRNAPPKPR
jgi:predicted RNA-binding protein YlqC (UPF0109 family)